MKFKCKICGESRSSKFRLLRHLEVVEKGKATQEHELKVITSLINELNGIYEYTCNTCGKIFGNQSIYNKHIKSCKRNLAKIPQQIIYLQHPSYFPPHLQNPPYLQHTQQYLKQSSLLQPPPSVEPNPILQTANSDTSKELPSELKIQKLQPIEQLKNRAPSQSTATPVQTDHPPKNIPKIALPRIAAEVDEADLLEIVRDEYLYLLTEIMSLEEACNFVSNCFHQDHQGDVALLDRLFFEPIKPPHYPVKCTDYANKLFTFKKVDGEYIHDTQKGINKMVNNIQNVYLMVQNTVIGAKMNQGLEALEELYTTRNMGAWQEGIYAKGRASNKEKFKTVLAKFLKQKDLEYKQEISAEIELKMDSKMKQQNTPPITDKVISLPNNQDAVI